MADVQLTIVDQENTQIALAAPAETAVNVAVPGIQGPTGATGDVAVAQDGTAALPGIRFQSDTNTGIYRPGADQVAISTNGTQRLLIDANGSLTAASATALVANFTGPANAYAQVTDGTGIFRAQLISNLPHIGAASNHSLVFTTNNTERMRLDTSGRLGLGTSSPQVLLHLQSTTKPSITLTENTGYGDNALGVTFAQLNFASADGSAAVATRASIESVFSDVFGATASLTFSTSATGAAAPVERLRITPSGNVGIGTQSPGTALDVNGAAKANYNAVTGALAAYVNSGGGLYSYHLGSGAGVINAVSNNSGTAGTLIFSTGSERARIDSSGRLLVGTSTARSVATISCGSQIESATYQLAAQSITNIAASALGPYLMFGKARSTSAGIVSDGDELGSIFFAGGDGTDVDSIGARINANVDGTPGNNDMPGRLVFLTTSDGLVSPAERMRITSTGAVLVGTTSTTANGGVLQVSNGITFPATQSACSDANTLDDYEEGDWTPEVTSSGTAPTVTYTAQVGNYVKIGRVVYCRLGIHFNITVGGTGNVFVSLPFTSRSLSTYGQHYDTGYTAGAVSIDNAAVISSTATAQLYTSAAAAADSAATTGTRNFTVSFFYYV